MDVGTKLDREGVIKILPHRDPFLFVDKVDSINAGPNEHLSGNDAIIGRTVRAWVHLSGKEDFFRGHFPGRPIMPGVLLVEAMAQASAVLAYIPKIHGPKIDMLLASVKNVRFRKPVLPPCDVRLEAVVKDLRRHFFHFECACYLDDQVAAEAELVASFSSKV